MKMEIVFRDKQHLRFAETADAAAQIRLPISVIKSLRSKLNFIRNAPDESTLRNWKSLHYEKLKGERNNQRSIRLNDQWRLVFMLETEGSRERVTILSVEDYH